MFNKIFISVKDNVSLWCTIFCAAFIHHSKILMMSGTKASSWPGSVGGNVPADPLALSLRGWGGITGAGLRGSLSPRPLWRGSQPGAAGTAQITIGLLLLNKHHIHIWGRRKARMTNNQIKQATEKKGFKKPRQPFGKYFCKKSTLSIILLNQNIKQVTSQHDQTARVNIKSITT